MIETHQSEFGRLKSVLLKHASDAFRNDLQIKHQSQMLNYLKEPNLVKAKEEYEAFIELLKSFDVELNFLPGNKETSLDSIYVRDASIATNKGMIICNMGKPQRSTETEYHNKYFQSSDIPIKGVIESPGTIEGGDVAWIDETTLAVGRGYRTNDAGIEQLKALIQDEAEVQVYHLPHYKGPSDVFHLMSVYSPVDKDLAVVYSPLMPVPMREELLRRSVELVEVPDEEFESMGCNVLAVAPKECIMVKGNPVIKSRLVAAGANVHVYDGEEISKKGNGGPTCLTRPLVRLI